MPASAPAHHHHHAMTTTPHRATPEQLGRVREIGALGIKGFEALSVICELLDRLAAAEQRISELEGTCLAAIPGNGATHPLQLAAGCRHEADSYPIGSPLRILLSDAAETLEILAPAAGSRIAEQRISELERLQSWIPSEVADSLDSLAERLSALEGSRPAVAGPASTGSAVKECLTADPAGSLVDGVRIAIINHGEGGECYDEAHAAILACAGWLELRKLRSALTAARWLRAELKRHG